jgi:two-component system, NarL family, sensor histidine kinase UhpB
VSVRLHCDATMVELRVQDNGSGFAPATRPAESPTGERRRLGLQGMRERAALIGGSLHVESPRGRGAAIIARFPLDGAAIPVTRRSRNRAGGNR